jgi:hypothetical protein
MAKTKDLEPEPTPEPTPEPPATVEVPAGSSIPGVLAPSDKQ